MPDVDHMEQLYSSSNPLVSFVHNNRLNVIVKTIAGNNLSVLDAGCGEGHLIERMHYANSTNYYYGVDLSEEKIMQSRRRCPYARIEKMPLTSLDFEKASFDVVVCTEVLEHIPDYKTAISEIKRVLRKGGLLFITFPNELLWTFSRVLLFRRPFKLPDHINSFNPNKMYSAVGLPVVIQRGLPFGLPFFISLGCLMVFRKP